MARQLRTIGGPREDGPPLHPFAGHREAASCREFAYAVLQQVVCETLKTSGFQRAEHSTILVLTEVLERCMWSIEMLLYVLVFFNVCFE